MTEINQTTDNVELEYEDNSKAVEMYEALVELEKNPHFQKVIMDGYFKDEAVRLTSLLATDYVRQSGARGTIMEQLVAVSSLEAYLATIVAMGAPIPDEE